jgi:hypothetical protein
VGRIYGRLELKGGNKKMLKERIKLVSKEKPRQLGHQKNWAICV